MVPVTEIRPGGNLLTLINVFTVSPENQDRLVNLLIEATEQTMRHLPGFVSASIHKSLDGGRVINYAQWESREDFEAMMNEPEARGHMAAAASFAEFDPILCEVSATFSVRGERF
ncbi:MAG: antibiotic biosynthesis monooxygenase [Actinobacteria bacterium]|nr:antibiotic biosynthesis monooxygenase [Actinomycetota bacterium]